MSRQGGLVQRLEKGASLVPSWLAARASGPSNAYRAKAGLNWAVWLGGRLAAAASVAISAHLMTRREFGLQIGATALSGVTAYAAIGSLSDVVARHVASSEGMKRLGIRNLAAEGRRCIIRFTGVAVVVAVVAKLGHVIPFDCAIEGLILGGTQALLNLIAGVFRGAGRLGSFAMASTAGTALGRLALVVGLIGLAGVRDARILLLAWIGWDVLQISFFSVVVRRHLDWSARGRLQTSRLFYWAGLLWPVLTNADLLAASWLVGPAAAASYGGPMRIGEMTTQVQFAYAAPFVAGASEAADAQQVEIVRRIYHKISREICLLTIPLTALVAINAQWCVHWLLGTRAAPNAAVLQVLLIGYTVQSCTGANYQALLVFRDMQFLGMTSICGVVGAVILIVAAASARDLVLVAGAMSASYVGVNLTWSNRLWRRWGVSPFDKLTSYESLGLLLAAGAALAAVTMTGSSDRLWLSAAIVGSGTACLALSTRLRANMISRRRAHPVVYEAVGE